MKQRNASVPQSHFLCCTERTHSPTAKRILYVYTIGTRNKIFRNIKTRNSGIMRLQTYSLFRV